MLKLELQQGNPHAVACSHQLAVFPDKSDGRFDRLTKQDVMLQRPDCCASLVLGFPQLISCYDTAVLQEEQQAID